MALVTLNDATIELIKRWEGLRLKAYPDPATGGDPWTIGYGHTSAAGSPGVKKGLSITTAEAETILKRDLLAVSDTVFRLVTVPLNPNQFGALVSFTFNLGAANLKKSTLLRLINEGKFDAAANQFARWNRAAGKVMKGLTKRREDEVALFLTPTRAVMPPEPIPDSRQDTVVITQTTGEPTAHTPTPPPSYGRILLSLGAVVAAIIAGLLKLFGVH